MIPACKLILFALPALAGVSMNSLVTNHGSYMVPRGKASMVPKSEHIFDGELVKDTEFAALNITADGTIKIPVLEGDKISQLWNLHHGFKSEPVAARSVSALKVPSDLKLIASSGEKAFASTKIFSIPSNCKTISLGIIGSGDVRSTYARLVVSIGTDKAMTWSQKSPPSDKSITDVAWSTETLVKKANDRPITAKIEVVTSGKVIGFGEFINSLNPNTLEKRPIIFNDFFEQLHVSKQIFRYLSIVKSKDIQSPVAVDIGLDSNTYEQMWYRIVENATSRPASRYFNDARDTEALSLQLEPHLLRILEDSSLKLNKLQCAYFTAIFSSYWVASNSDYYTNNKISAEEQFIQNAPVNSLRNGGRMQLQCNGFSVLTRDLSEKLGARYGLKAKYVWGWFRHQRKALDATPQGNHAWVQFDIGEGVILPSDPTTLHYQMKWGGGVPTTSVTGNVWVLPIRKDHLEVFYASRWGLPLERDKRRVYDVNINPEFTDQYRLKDPSINLTWDQWRKLPLEYLKKVETYLNQTW